MSQSCHEELLVASRQQDLSSADVYNSTVIEDLLFLDAWEGGQAKSLSAYFRARQIRRANPVRSVARKKAQIRCCCDC
jgi:hypothetical protein